MSRTDKDDPYEVMLGDTTRDVTEWHVCNKATESRRYQTRFEECDLPPRSEIGTTRNLTWRHRPRCTYQLAGEHPWPSPPSWFARQVWHKPERARERREMTKAKQFYRRNATDVYSYIYGPQDYGTGLLGPEDEGFDFPNYQHRNSARWLWW